MDDYAKKQRQIYDILMKDARENNTPVYRSRELTPEEVEVNRLRHEEIVDYLKALDKFQKDSRERGRDIVARMIA